MSGKRRSGLPLATPIAAVGTLLCALVAALFPLTGTPGPEAAQLLALVGGPLLMIAGAARGATRQERGFVGDLASQGLLLAVCFFGFMAIIMVAGWSHESCAPGRGYLPFFALALPVLITDSAIGVWIGRLTGSSRVAVVTTVALLLGYVLWLLIDWYLHPTFRVLSHLLVLVEGDLLRGRGLSPAGWAYRMATLALGIALCFVGASRYPRARRGGLSAAPSSNPAFVLAAGVLVVLAGVVHTLARDEIAPSRNDLEEAYSLERRRGSLIVRADPRHSHVVQVEGLLAEGTLWLDRLEKRMGAKPAGDIVIWLHKDSATLGRWTGADHVHFALPMHRELHIAESEVPHRSLGHELVHVVGRELSGGLLGVPSRLFVLANSGLIEGLAMAMTPELEVDDGLTLREKAAAMRRAGLAPDVRGLFGEYGSFFSFWREAPGRAYVTAGALMEAVAAEKGAQGLQTVYREGSLAAAFASDEELEAFITQHERDLDGLELSGDAVAQVSRTYARPSILDETCDRRGRATADAIRAAARSGDFDRAEGLAREAEEAIRGSTYIGLAREARALQRFERATQYLVRSTRSGDTHDPVEIAARLSAAGDALWLAGQRREAIALWERIDAERLAPYPRRLVLGKRLLANAVRAAGGQAPLAEAGLELLLQDDRRGDDAARVARLAQALAAASAHRPDVVAFARYLLARQYIQRGAVDDGLELLLQHYEAGGVLPAAFEVEALRALATGHARRGDLTVAAAGYQSLTDRRDLRPALRIELRDRAERTSRMAAAEPGTPTEGDRFLLGFDAEGPL